MDSYSWIKRKWLNEKRKDKLSQLLNLSPNYRYRGEYISDVYGLNWNNEKFMIYYSQRGLTVQVNENFNNDLMETFLDELIDLLVDNTSEFYNKYLIKF